MRSILAAITLASSINHAGAFAQRVDTPPQHIIFEEIDPFEDEREQCWAKLPYQHVEMRLRYVGYGSTPNYKWSLDADGTLTFIDFSKVELDEDEVSDGDGEVITAKMTCFVLAEIQALARAMIEPSPEEQTCAIFVNHATFGLVSLKRGDSDISRYFSLGCTDLENPGFNAAVRAMDDRVMELVGYQGGDTSESD